MEYGENGKPKRGERNHTPIIVAIKSLFLSFMAASAMDIEEVRRTRAINTANPARPNASTAKAPK
ncbi:MAG: hypothetical protein ASUL_09409 [Candidatus Aramenus sulfurataquae]|uniref:Uncharacterized protein n=1 Tax=Candidatus Aramenus sulfurataquae TaxID=1326980 RepID=W7KV30_9CREN|nr:MAG: hypothetical protein ASUL_09409 [Candidatus Aramenus sulfurataquae]